MSICLVRIDDRLIHGQVVAGWLGVIGADTILVVSDELAANETEKILFSLAVPAGVRVDCLSIHEAAARLMADAYARALLLILVEGPGEIVSLLDKGVQLSSINVGGLHYAPGKISIHDVLYLSIEECAMLEAIAARGVVVEGRILPNDTRMNVVAEIRRINGATA